MRAATSMFLISLAKSLPRRASTTAFLCLVVAHLECPDMACSVPCLRLDEVDEHLVDPRVAGHLGVEGRGQQVALPDRDDPTGGGAPRDRPRDLRPPARPPR